MSWQNINLNDVPTGRELLPTGEYNLEVLPGAGPGKFDPDSVEFTAAVVGGEFSGRRVFISYPDPEKQDWSPMAFKRLTVALGVEPLDEEKPIPYLTRVSGLRFRMPISIKDVDGGQYQRVNLFNPKPARD